MRYIQLDITVREKQGNREISPPPSGRSPVADSGIDSPALRAINSGMTTPDSSTSAEILKRSRTAWNEESRSCANQGCIPVDHATIKRARAGDWSVVFTPHLPMRARVVR